ncbi:MAG: argininosuccinate synthase, partial [Planctomycetes bacterium]|nr:argininosuccinate synthase [Planctomycetota bacterium]
ACYEAGYYLAVAMSRPLIVREMAKIAEENGCQYVAHGGVRTGNDRARFETAVADLDPTLDVIFPPAEWNLASRSEEEEYAKRFQLRYRKRDRAGYYTLDENMWGRTVRWEGLDDGWLAPPPEAYYLTVDPREAPDEPTEVTIRFAAGVPVALDGEKLEPVALIQRMNQIGGRHGVGRTDIVENPLSGVKKRQTYEAPAAHILITAHQALEDVVLPKEILHFQKPLSQKYSELIYEGFWFDDIRLALDDFFLRIQKRVVGEVRVRLFKGSSLVTGRRAS